MELKWLFEQWVTVAVVFVFVALVLAGVVLYDVDLMAYREWIKVAIIGGALLLVTMIVKLKNRK